MKETVTTSVQKFIKWHKSFGYVSYDQYDFWSTHYGIWSKAIYYKNKFLGIPLVAPVFAVEIFCPYIRMICSRKKRFPIADAHFILAYLNLFEQYSNKKYLAEAKSIADELLKSSINGYSGYCWGYPFNWMTTRGLWKSGVPLITTTVYCFEAYKKLYEVTGEYKYLRIARSIFNFTINDINDTPVEQDISSSSYSPIDNSQVVNANAYRSWVLVEGSILFDDKKALEKANSNINFILNAQQEDGSWLYAVNDKRDHFIDNFHTCFVLKNLLKINKILKDEKINRSISKGFNFYKNNLFDQKGSPKPFAKLSRFNVVKKELYDYAEGISLCLQMQERDKDALRMVKLMVEEVVSKFQKKNGSFTTRIHIFNIPNNIPFLRWPQAQIFFALTNFTNNNHH